MGHCRRDNLWRRLFHGEHHHLAMDKLKLSKLSFSELEELLNAVQSQSVEEIDPQLVKNTLPHSSTDHTSSPHLTLPHLTLPHLTSPHLTPPHLTPPHLTSPHTTSPPHTYSSHHLISHHLTSPPYFILIMSFLRGRGPFHFYSVNLGNKLKFQYSIFLIYISRLDPDLAFLFTHKPSSLTDSLRCAVMYDETCLSQVVCVASIRLLPLAVAAVLI